MNKLLSIIFIVAPTMYFGYVGKPTEMGIALLMGTLVSAFINLDKFSSFKGAGFEAQLKEAKETVEKAQVTIEILKEILQPLLFNTLHSITYMGRLSAGGPTANKDTIRDGCKQIISTLNIDSPELTDIISTYDRYIIWDCYNQILNKIRSCSISDTLYEQLNVDNKYSNNNYPSLDFIYRAFSDNNIPLANLPTDVSDAIKNYQHRLANNTCINEL